MQLSTVKRERLIPPVYLLSIALLLTVAFIVLLPSSDIFTLTAQSNSTDTRDIQIDDLDVAYVRAGNAAGSLPASEMERVISAMIRGRRWEDANSLMASRPDIDISANDKFLLHLESTIHGYQSHRSEADKSSYAAGLITLLSNFLDQESMHDTGTLTRAAEVSAELEQPELAASYRLELASTDPTNAVEHLHACATILSQYQLHGQAESCYRSAIANSLDTTEKFELSTRLIYLLSSIDKTFAANQELEKLAGAAPKKVKVLRRLAALSLSLGRPELAYPLYAQLSELDESRPVFWLEKAAIWSEAANFPGLAAEYVATIIELTDKEYHDELIDRRQSLLIAAGRNEDALQTIHERLLDQPDNTELLLDAVTLASNMGLNAQAIEWNERLLIIDPQNTDTITRQIELALATRQLGEALRWAQSMLEIEPKNKQTRIRLAQLEEWNGNINSAQQHRQWLADAYPSDENDLELIRLSELNWDSATAAKTLQRIGSRQPLSRENILKLVRLHEADGRPDLAAQSLVAMQQGQTADPMLYRELAALHKRHNEWDQSLAAWQTFADKFGRSSEESVNRMELHWRLKQPQQALEMAAQVDEEYLPSATPYQLELMSELGWRYRAPSLVLASAPYLERTDIHDGKRLWLARRVIQSHLDNDDPNAAIEYAEWIWRSSADDEFLLASLDIALREDVYPHRERYLDAAGELILLREMPDYWLTVAEYYNRQSDTLAALDTYESALTLDPDNVEATTGYLWTLMGQSNPDHNRLAATLEKYQPAAVDKPELWSAFAIAHLRLNDAKGSLRWFSKIMLHDEHDYNLLLSFADALEQTGNNPHAFKVRQYALGKLRPLVLAQTGDKTNDLARDYISLLRRFGSTGENEAWTTRLLADVSHATAPENAWRQEMAAAWYLTTQRNDYARLILTKMHEKRLETPVWQQLALAVADDDFNTIEEILASDKTLSNGDHILALRKIGDEKQAYQLALNTMETGVTVAERRNATDHVMSMRAHRPGYVAATMNRTVINNLDITETGLSLRNTLDSADLGISVGYHQRQLAHANGRINGSEDDLKLTVHFGNSLRGGSVTTGINAREESELNYSGGELYLRDRIGRNELSTEVYINEIADSSEALRLGAKRDRAKLSYAHTTDNNQYVRFTGELDELLTRDTNQTVSSSVGASVELGTTRTLGSNSWTMGIVASQKNHTSEGMIRNTNNGTPAFISYRGAFEDDQQELSLNAALFRGGIGSEYPQAASPRYHVSARVGHNWPREATAFTLSAGAGFRVIGNDELSFSVAHDSNVEQTSDRNSNASVGVQYRNHF